MSRRSFARRLEDFFLLEILPPVGALLIRGLYHTLRVKHLDYHKVKHLFTEGQSTIFAFWHGQLLMMPYISISFPRWSRFILISRHRDGELITRIISRFGYAAVRGSKSRGGFGALRQILKFINEGKTFVITPDGPRGPRHQVKINVIQVARATGVPILPMAFGAKSYKSMGSWDGFIVPYPFTRAAFVWGEPLWVKDSATEEEMEAARLALEQTLNELTAKAQEAARGDSGETF